MCWERGVEPFRLARCYMSYATNSNLELQQQAWKNASKKNPSLPAFNVTTTFADRMCDPKSDFMNGMGPLSRGTGETGGRAGPYKLLLVFFCGFFIFHVLRGQHVLVIQIRTPHTFPLAPFVRLQQICHVPKDVLGLLRARSQSWGEHVT